ncbi:hypothetical protein NMG60_11009627 [Bertholletia excelsa]
MAANSHVYLLATLFIFALVLSPVSQCEGARELRICPRCLCCAPPPAPGLCCPCLCRSPAPPPLKQN